MFRTISKRAFQSMCFIKYIFLLQNTVQTKKKSIEILNRIYFLLNMRLLQNISVLEGIDTKCYPGEWTDVTSDSSVQIISLDPAVPEEISDTPTRHNRLSEKAWLSDSCLNDPVFTRHAENKDFASTGDLTNKSVNNSKHSWKPILRKPSKPRKTAKKSVSFKASEAETRYFIKYDINKNTKVDIQSNQAFTYFDIRHAEVGIRTDANAESGEDLILRKPIVPASEVKVAKVVKCQTVSKHSASHAIKRKLAHNDRETNGIYSSSIDTGLSEIDEDFPELMCKMPRYTANKRNRTDIGPLSKFLMENDREMLTSTPNLLTKSCPNILESRNQCTPSEKQQTLDKNKSYHNGTRTRFRMGTSNLKTVRCQRKLIFNEHVNTNISEVISSINQQLESVDSSPKPVRPRLGLQCKASKLVDLDNLDISLVCELKNKISKCNVGMKIKTNGSLQCKSKPRTSVSSPMGKCFKSTVRPSPVSLRQSLRVAPYLETFV